MTWPPGHRVAKTPVQQRSLAMAMYLERGIPVIYYGEELGLHNLEFDNADQFADETVADFVKEAGEAGVDEKTALAMASQTHKLPARGQCLGTTASMAALALLSLG